jgi:hypothetical protein
MIAILEPDTTDQVLVPLRTLRWVHWPNAHRPQVLRLRTLDRFCFICALSAIPSGLFQYWIIFGQTLGGQLGWRFESPCMSQCSFHFLRAEVRWSLKYFSV